MACAEALAIGVCATACCLGMGLYPGHRAQALSETTAPGPMGSMAMPPPRSHARGPNAPIPVARLTGPRSAAHVRAFTLTARPAQLSLAPGARVDAWTYDGTAPGPTLRVRQGDLVVVRLVNTDVDMHLATLLGAGFTVAALDGRDLVGPWPLTATLLPIAAGGRYDVRFRVPARGTIGVYLADDRRGLMRPVATVGASPSSPVLAARRPPVFDLAAYGTPRSGAITLRTRVDASYTLRLGDDSRDRHGFAAIAHPNPRYTINSGAGSAIAPIMVRRGQLVRLRIVNESDYIHPMRLHGHSLAVLARDGRPLRGSPVTLDTLDVLPGESYDVAFRANNPGIWMLHCHNLYHARYGMSMMVMYEGVGTPFKPGGRAGNVSD
jgi:FtsP/CotA-like multicopper oxidase with cupredoxin domain